MKIETATVQDAEDLAYLINIAGEGIPEYLWTDMAEGDETPMSVGARRAAREEGGFSYRNAKVCRVAGEVAAMIISYQQDNPVSLENLHELPEVVRPMIVLEAKAPGSWYVNALATKEKYRGKGIAKLLLKDAEEMALSQNVRQMSIIVASENETAKTLYTKIGYQMVDSQPVVPYPNAIHGGRWELLIKPLIEHRAE